MSATTKSTPSLRPSGLGADGDQRFRFGWAAVALLLVGATAALLVADGAGWHGYLALAGFLVANAALLSRAHPSRRAQSAYLGAACVAGVLLVHEDSSAWLVLVLLVPQVFAFIEHTAVAVTVFLTLMLGVTLATRSPAPEGGSPLSQVLAATVAVATAIAVGLTVKALLRETRHRGYLINELTLAREELASTQHAAGVAAERSRLTLEIHDTLAQGFTSVLTLIQAADASLDAQPHLTRQRLALAQQTARDNLLEARALVEGSGPTALATDSLSGAVRRLAENLHAELGVPVDVTVNESDYWSPPGTVSQVVVLRVLQEALSNIRQHAAALGVQIRLSFEVDEVRLDVEDDGHGFDPSACTPGRGLAGMRSRVDSIGGTLDLHSSPGVGTSITVKVPS